LIFNSLHYNNIHCKENSPIPLYFQLYSLLKHNILNGSLEFGYKLPTELALSKEFSISRITAKRALDELASESLVERK
jgi:GntR family transcriptional regulator